MPALSALVRLVVLALVAGAASSGCMYVFDRPCIQPFPEAVVRVPVPLEREAPARGACGAWVEYDGIEYTDTGHALRAEDAWTITETDLEVVGTASGRTGVTPAFVDASVYSIDGVPTSDAIAMRGSSPPGTIVVLVASRLGSTYPAGLCRYLADAAPGSHCEAEPS